MNIVQAFWAFLYSLQHYTEDGCLAVTQSTHSTPATHQVVVYGGNCLQAFVIALKSGGSIAWEFVSNLGQAPTY